MEVPRRDVLAVAGPRFPVRNVRIKLTQHRYADTSRVTSEVLKTRLKVNNRDVVPCSCMACLRRVIA
eukprot:12483336-Alexandrium_andersonii.AAC.1